MALRFANKIHCIVNNVMTQSLGLRVQAVLASSAPPKTRYPLNETDANSYIEQLKERAHVARQQCDPNEPDVVRTFNVDLQARPRAPRDSIGVADMGSAAQRYLSTDAGNGNGKKWSKSSSCEPDDCNGNGKKKKKAVQCKPGGAVDPEKCPKKEEVCKKLKMDNCEPATVWDCTKRPFIFKDCKKVLSPYPSFSEACYEPLPDVIHECKSCPYDPARHPTFKGPMNKFAGRTAPDKKGQKRKFHTGASRWVTLRFGEVGPDPKDLKAQEIENEPRPIRPANLMRVMMTQQQIDHKTAIAPPRPRTRIRKFSFKPLPDDQTMPRVQFRSDEMDESRREIQVNEEKKRMEETLARLENMILAKNRIRVIGSPLCNVRECDQPQMKQKKCPKKIKSRVCPTDLLDRKPYKKYREGVRRRREKCKEKQRKGKTGKGKHAAAEHDQESLDAMIMHQHAISQRSPDQPSV